MRYAALLIAYLSGLIFGTACPIRTGGHFLGSWGISILMFTIACLLPAAPEKEGQ